MRPAIPMLALDSNPMLKKFPNDKTKSHSARKSKKNTMRKKRVFYHHQHPLTDRQHKINIIPYPPSRKLNKLTLPQIIELDDDENTLRDAMISQWISKHNKQDPSESAYASPAIYCLTKLFEVKNMTAHLIHKHPFRIAVICDLFSKLCQHQQYAIIKPFQYELFKLIFADYDPKQNYNVYKYIKMFHQQKRRTKHENQSEVDENAEFLPKIEEQKSDDSLLKEPEIQSLTPFAINRIRLYKNHSKRLQDRANYALSFVVFRVWKRYTKVLHHRLKMYPRLQIFEALNPSKNTIFKSWRRTAHYWSMRKMKTELSDSHRTIAQLNVRNQNLQVEMIAAEKRNAEHIAQLTMDLYRKNLDENAEQQMAELKRDLSVKWIRYMMQLNIRVLTKRRDELSALFDREELYDPYVISYTLKHVSNFHFMEFEFDILHSKNLEKLSVEDVLLNWVNYVLLSHKVENQSQNIDSFIAPQLINFAGGSRKSSVYGKRGSIMPRKSIMPGKRASIFQGKRASIFQGKRSSIRASDSLPKPSLLSLSSLKETEQNEIWKRSINNFSEDWRNGDAYLTLLVLLFYDAMETHLLSDLNVLTTETKLSKVISNLNNLGINDDRLITAEKILNGDDNINIIILSRLLSKNSKMSGQDVLLFGVDEDIDLLNETLLRTNKLYKSRKGREVSDIMKFQLEVDGALNEANQRLKHVERLDKLWRQRIQDITNYGNKILANKLRKQSCDTITLIHDGLTKTNTLKLLHDITLERVTKYMNNATEEQLERIRLLIQKHRLSIVKIFQQFCKITQKRKISNNERDLNGSDKAYFPKLGFPEFIGVLQYARICNQKFTVKNACTLFRGGKYQSKEFTISQFVVGLIKIASYKYVGEEKKLNVANRVQMLLEDHFKKFVYNPFLNNIMHDLEIISVVYGFEQKLRKIYSACINISIILRDRIRQTEATRSMSTMDQQNDDKSWRKYATVAGTAQVLYKDCLIQKEYSSINEKAIIKIMRQIQKYSVDFTNNMVKIESKSTDPFYQSVVFEEFIQLMVALSLYAQPSPFILNKTKLFNFLSVLKMQKRRNKYQNQQDSERRI